MRQMEKVS